MQPHRPGTSMARPLCPALTSVGLWYGPTRLAYTGMGAPCAGAVHGRCLGVPRPPTLHAGMGEWVRACGCVCVCACMPPCARAPVSACVRVDACKRGSCPHARTHTYTQPSTGDDAHCPISARAPWRRQLRRHRLLGHSLGGRHTAAAAGLAASPSCCCVGRLLLSTRAQPHSAASRGIQKN